MTHGKDHARDGIGEFEEVARELRHRIDRLQRHRGADFGGSGFNDALRPDGDLFQCSLGGLRSPRRQIDCGGRGYGEGDGGFGTGPGIDSVRTGLQAGNRVAAVLRGFSPAGDAGGDVPGDHIGVRGGFAAQRGIRGLGPAHTGYADAGGKCRSDGRRQ